MKTLIAQTRDASKLGLYYVALQSSLTIPDIAGALIAGDRRASSSRYAHWFDTWVRSVLSSNRNRENPFSGEQCYRFRCSMLHQGASHREDLPYKRIMFVEPGHPNGQLHYVVLGSASAEPALLIQIDEFIEEMLVGCERWLNEVAGTQPFENNYALFARRHPTGLKPWLSGVPVIG
ncbi:MAG: hypothetical protein Q8O29_19295 [Polaromonas sp.]|uniref:hypothetical protein n=1 Tax=Polaromonas sp. TaxID=1869339 RepID=UPI0027375D1D|nr:hypothetical protein [Polaromonas sp.]MDP2820379.1 hypothetical protein [Polaromonas sp.]